MANGLSNIAAAQAAPSRTGTIPGPILASPVKQARFLVTGNGTEIATEWHVLGRLPESGYQIIPELSRIRQVAGAWSIVATIQRQNAAGTVTALTNAVTTNNGAVAAAWAGANNTEPPTLDSTDTLRLLLSTGGTFPVPTSASFIVELAYKTVEA
jgi:hypothetical protein